MSGISYAEMTKSEHLYDVAVKQGHPDISRDEIAKQAALDDAEVFVVIGKEIKKHHESIEMFKQGNRPELVKQEEAELAVLNAYMPKQMSRDEIVAEVRRVIAEVGAKGPSDKNKVMPKLMAALKGKAEGRLINEVVTELLI
jgi:uncharacterized protein YqeY